MALKSCVDGGSFKTSQSKEVLILGVLPVFQRVLGEVGSTPRNYCDHVMIVMFGGLFAQDFDNHCDSIHLLIKIRSLESLVGGMISK